MKGNPCQWKGCTSPSTSRSDYCQIHATEHRKRYLKSYVKKRMVLTKEPKSARHNKITWELWEAFQDLKPNEIEMLVTKRISDIKYAQKYRRDLDKINQWRTEIAVLRDIYKKQRGRDLELGGWKKTYGED